MSAYDIGAARIAAGLCGQSIRSRENVRAVVGTLAFIISEAAPTENHRLVCADTMLLEAMMLSDQFVPASLFFRANQLHTDFFSNDFSEKQVLCRVEGQKGKGFLVVLFPYKQGEERPTFAPWQGGDGLKISWKGETHCVLLDTHEHQIDSDVLKGKTSAVVVKLKGEKLASNRCSYHDGPLTGNAQ